MRGQSHDKVLYEYYSTMYTTLLHSILLVVQLYGTGTTVRYCGMRSTNYYPVMRVHTVMVHVGSILEYGRTRDLMAQRRGFSEREWKQPLTHTRVDTLYYSCREPTYYTIHSTSN